MDDLLQKLESMTGTDYEAAEKRCRTLGDNTQPIGLSTQFHIELAALALETNSAELKNLPLKKYAKILNTVQGFLFGNLGAETQSES